MQQRWQHRVGIVAALILGACAADTAAPDDLGTPEDPQAVSGLSLALTSMDSHGRAYRLRNATFSIAEPYYYYYDGGAPPAPTVVSSEDDPGSSRLSVRLVPGYYQVTLGGDWYLERLTPAGSERVAQVALLTPSVQDVYIGDGWNYDVEFRFGVDGSLIDFRHGDLDIDISIELPGEGPSNPRNDGGFIVDAATPAPITDGGVEKR